MNPAQMMARMNRMEAAMKKLMTRQTFGAQLGDVPSDVPDDLPADYMSKRRDFYIYNAQALALAPAGNATFIVQIEADSNFILQKLTYNANIANAAYTATTRPIPSVTVLLQDTGSGRQLMQNPIPIPSFFGTGELPFVLQNPRVFLRNTTIQVTFANFDAAVTYNLRLAFIGYKVYGTA